MEHYNKELNLILKLNGLEDIRFPSDKFFNIANQITNNIDKVKWNFFMTKEAYEEEKALYDEKIKNVSENLNFSYYDNIFSKSSKVFDFLQPAKINTNELQLLQKNNVNLSFVPDCQNDFLSPPKYSLINSATGRMTIESGPKILYLDKSNRKIIKSKFANNGSLYYIDFVSLEPRVLLLSSLTNGHLPEKPEDIPKDVYMYTLEKTNLINLLSRDEIKKIILAQCYGMNKDLIIELLNKNKNIKNSKNIINVIEDFFKLSEMKNKLLSELEKSSNHTIENIYGRKIKINKGDEYKVINYYIQSSAVDISLLGIYSIFEKLSNIKDGLKYISPLYIIHDAVIFDVHNSFKHLIPKLCDYGSKHIFGFENNIFFINFGLLKDTF